MDIPFEVDVQWLTQSMIQRACERHMNYHKKWTTYIEERPPYEKPLRAEYGKRKVSIHFDRIDEEVTVRTVPYDPNIPDTDSKDYDEQTLLEQQGQYNRYSTYQSESTLPKYMCNILTKLYTNVPYDDCQKVLNIYAERINETDVLIEPTDEQSDVFYGVIRELYKEKEQSAIIDELKHGNGDYNYSVLDLTRMTEHPTHLGSHWEEMSKIIQTHYQKEWQEVFALNDYEAENKWIYDHFYFVGKSEYYSTFRQEDSELYGGIAATGYVVRDRTSDIDENKLIIDELAIKSNYNELAI